jgi:hypothetical protein
VKVGIADGVLHVVMRQPPQLHLAVIAVVVDQREDVRLQRQVGVQPHLRLLRRQHQLVVRVLPELVNLRLHLRIVRLRLWDAATKHKLVQEIDRAAKLRIVAVNPPRLLRQSTALLRA